MDRSELLVLRRALEALAPVPDVEWEHLRRSADVRALPRGTELVREGEPVDWLGFLARGLVRIFRRAGEREVTLGFDCEGRFIGAYDAWATRAPARYALETLEPSLVVRLDRACVAELETRHAC